MKYFNDLTGRQIRDRTDLVQVFEESLRVRRESEDDLLGTMRFEVRNEAEYLYRWKPKGRYRSGRSLGPRSAETEKILNDFKARQAVVRERLEYLSGEIEVLARIMLSHGLGRVPVLAARVLRRLYESPMKGRFRVVGTYALYAYEAAASVMFDGNPTTGDMLIDDRAPLRIMMEPAGEGLAGGAIGLRGFEAIVKSVDASFEQRKKGDFRLTNKDGFMVEFSRPEARPAHRRMPGARTDIDAVPAPITELEWLVSVPRFEATVLDMRGYPLRMSVPAPAAWTAHKLWVSTRQDRDPGTSTRDRAQADAVIDLIEQRLPKQRPDRRLHSSMPKELADAMVARRHGDGDVKGRIEPGW